MAPIICPVCRQQWESSFKWYVCDCCGNRVCPHCMQSGRQKGPYGVGFKCGQFIKGWMKETHF